MMPSIARKRVLAAWLLAGPLLLAAGELVLPGMNLYGTPAEKPTLAVLLLLPVLGVVGISRYLQATLLVRLLLCAVYLVGGVMLALLAVIFIGCSWAGACF